MPHETLSELYRTLVHWGAPIIALFGVKYVAQIAASLRNIQTSLAVVVNNIEGLTKGQQDHDEKIDDHSERIAKLEVRLGARH